MSTITGIFNVGLSPRPISGTPARIMIAPINKTTYLPTTGGYNPWTKLPFLANEFCLIGETADAHKFVKNNDRKEHQNDTGGVVLTVDTEKDLSFDLGCYQAAYVRALVDRSENKGLRWRVIAEAGFDADGMQEYFMFPVCDLFGDEAGGKVPNDLYKYPLKIKSTSCVNTDVSLTFGDLCDLTARSMGTRAASAPWYPNRTAHFHVDMYLTAKPSGSVEEGSEAAVITAGAEGADYSKVAMKISLSDSLVAKTFTGIKGKWIVTITS